MATKINEECIRCGACRAPCPNNAISRGEEVFIIDPRLCTECVGFYDRQACADVCPVDSCVSDPDHAETEDILIERARILHPEIEFGQTFKSHFRKN